MLNALFRRLRALYPDRGDLAFVLHTRNGCHLCDTAWQQLLEAQSLYRFTLEKQDVDADPDLAAKYGNCVPVVTVNGKVRFRGAVNAVLLKRILQAPVVTGAKDIAPREPFTCKPKQTMGSSPPASMES